MSQRIAALRLTLCRAVLIGALPTACAVGVTQEGPGGTSDPIDTAGSSHGGMPGASGSMGVLPKAGSAGSAAVNPFGGSASTAGSGSGGQSSAGAGGSGGKAGSNGGGAGGVAGSTAGGSGGRTSGAGTSGGGTSGAGTSGAGTSGAGTSGAGGTATGGCACPMPKTWADDTSMNFGPGDCLDVKGAIYLYTGTKAQVWAHKDCNPTMQDTWCTSADYKFMLCK